MSQVAIGSDRVIELCSFKAFHGVVNCPEIKQVVDLFAKEALCLSHLRLILLGHCFNDWICHKLLPHVMEVFAVVVSLQHEVQVNVIAMDWNDLLLKR